MDYLDIDIKSTECIKLDDKITYIVKYTQKDLKIGNFITVNYDYVIRMHKMKKYASIGNLVLWMPIVNGSITDINMLLHLIDRMNWKGKLIMYDIECKLTEDWIKKLPRFDSLFLCNIYKVGFSAQVFKIVWDKIPITKKVESNSNKQDDEKLFGLTSTTL